MLVADPVWKTDASLGEGPLWWEDSLYWVDILRPALHRFTPESGERKTWALDEQTGTVVPLRAGGLLLAQESGIVHFAPETGASSPLPWPADCPIAGRFNDGKCDPQGRFWVGTMGRDEPVGHLYRIDADGSVHTVLEGIRISNGLCWDEACGLFYYIDSPTGRIDAFDWDGEKGTISARRTIARLPEGQPGVPDGMTIDREGRLWVAVFDGGAVHCIDPRSGVSLEKIEVPAPRTTACWFGGEALDELYITTATIGLEAEALAANPLSGSLFCCRPGARGWPANACRIEPGKLR